jgi:hypothetical protein
LNNGCWRRDGQKCVVCDSPNNLQAGHLIAYKDRNDKDIEERFKRCYISGIQDVSNAITLCADCHQNFDWCYFGINPFTSKLEISKALTYSRNPTVRDKWRKLKGKEIKPATTAGHWPSVEAFNEKYSKAVTVNIIQNFMIHFQDKHRSPKLIASDLQRTHIARELKDWFQKNIGHFHP